MNRHHRRAEAFRDRKADHKRYAYAERHWHSIVIVDRRYFTKRGGSLIEDVLEWLDGNAAGRKLVDRREWPLINVMLEDEDDATLFKIWVAGR